MPPLVDEIWWSKRLSPRSRYPHFPYFVTHYTYSMPCQIYHLIPSTAAKPTKNMVMFMASIMQG